MSAIEKIKEIINTTSIEDLPQLYNDMLDEILPAIGDQSEQLAAQLRAGLDETDFDELMAWLDTDDKG